MTSLQGYITATYQQLVEALGEPDYMEASGDGKVETEWEWYDEDHGPITIYDWKQFDGGATSRSGQPYVWHIGGAKSAVVDVVDEMIDNVTVFNGAYWRANNVRSL